MANNTTADAMADGLSAPGFLGHPLWGPLFWSGIVFLLSWLTVRGVDMATTRSARKFAALRHMDVYETKSLVGRTKPMRLSIRLVVGLLAVIALAGIWGLQTAFTGLLAGAGFAGIVIGMAAGDTIGDLIAGFLIFYNRPFDLGDWVEIDGVQGIVEDVGIGATTLITFDNEKITIPNRLVEGTKVKNFTHARKLRFRIPVGVTYGTHLGRAMQLLKEIAMEHPMVLDNPLPMGITAGFGPSSVDLELRVWVEPVRNSVLAVKTDLVHTIHDRFRKEGIEIAFPHMQIVQGEAWSVDNA